MTLQVYSTGGLNKVKHRAHISTYRWSGWERVRGLLGRVRNAGAETAIRLVLRAKPVGEFHDQGDNVKN
jgi:hypothetical protein